MTASIEVPEDISFGYVTDHVLLAVGDGDDADDYPDAIAAEGSVTFTPVSPNVTVHGGDATIAIQPITATVRESDGHLTYNGKAGVWLVVGDYKVRWTLKGAKITDATIRVTADHTPENPLVLARQVEIKPTPTMKLVVNEELYRHTEALVDEARGIVGDLSGTIESEIIRITSEGDYRGPSAYEVAVATGFEGTEPEWLESLRGDPAPLPSVSWSGPRLTVGDATSPDLTGPQGAPGAVPTAADYMVVGPGRPDAPTTTGMSSAALDALPVGAEYRSTDGASVGAWVWRKRPTGWQCVDGDTGWRTLLTDLVQEPWQGHERGGVGRGAHNIRRVGTQVHWLTYWYQNTGGNGWFGTIPGGFKLPNAVPGGGYGTQEAGRSGSTILTIQNGDRLMVSGHTSGEIRIYATWTTAEPWPTAPPGTPA